MLQILEMLTQSVMMCAAFCNVLTEYSGFAFFIVGIRVVQC